MHSDALWLEILFRVCLFSVLGYKLYQLARQYLVPFCVEYIHEQRKRLAELFDKEKLLVSTRKRLENQVTQQKQQFVSLEKNVQRWITYQREVCQEAERTNRLLIQQFEEKRGEQKKNMKYMILMQETLANACDQAHQKLIGAYEDKKGQVALSNLVKQMSVGVGQAKKSS